MNRRNSTGPATARPRDGDEALEHLLEGNQRFVDDAEIEANRSTARRVELAEGQEPYAIVLGCSDSRVPPEVVFDQGLGELFVVRVAGNTADAGAVVGSIEYAVAELGSVLVMVLGHQECGAVKGAIATATEGEELPGAIADVVDPIVPVIDRVAKEDPELSEEELVERCVQANVEAAVRRLEDSSPLLAQERRSGKLKIVGAEYVLASGEVRLL